MHEIIISAILRIIDECKRIIKVLMSIPVFRQHLYGNRSSMKKQRRKKIRKLIFFLFLGWYLLALPKQLFHPVYSTVLLDQKGQLLGARIAKDGQWRFRSEKPVPEKIATCLIQFEDKHFRTHIGISLSGITRALVQNTSQGKIVSGGSTITQQVIRIMRGNPSRTYIEKVYEILLATRLEWSYSKKEILKMYCDHAPFGTNVVGLEAAAWRYFGRAPEELSWAESATLAVLPNVPGLIYPGKNHEALLQKRNRLLKSLYDEQLISDSEYYLALEEPIPGRPLPLPNNSNHLLEYFIQHGSYGRIIRSSIRSEMQEMVESQTQNYLLLLKESGIMNAAVIVCDNRNSEVLAYLGNVDASIDPESHYVDCNRALRSTGSILKPLLYAKALEKGILTPQQLLPDYPSQFGSFSPNNFNRTYSGLVHADKALSKSLNIPMVHLLREYGLPRFYDDLKLFGFNHIRKNPSYYGLSLILGGAEASPTEVSECYVNLARILLHEQPQTLTLIPGQTKSTPTVCNRGAIYAAFKAMLEVNRPDEDNNWKAFESAQKIAWKTGTSFGFRDAWAVGVTPDYTVTVWIGNADGEGRPGLTGVKAAAPLLFSIFKQLPVSGHWFSEPKREMTNRKMCLQSGMIAGEYCPETRFQNLPATCANNATCTYHRPIHLDQTETCRVSPECYPYDQIRQVVRFIIPPAIEKYYALENPSYIPLPPYSSECSANVTKNALNLVYPRSGASIFIPREIDGKRGHIIAEAAHSSDEILLYWHLDGIYLGTTTQIHQMSLQPDAGKHVLEIVDQYGEKRTSRFFVR